MEENTSTKKRTTIEIITSHMDMYEGIIQNLPYDGQKIIDSKNFKILTAPWRKAANEANLILRKGRIYTKNNLCTLPYLFFPTSITIYTTDFGKILAWPDESIIIARSSILSKKSIKITYTTEIPSDEWKNYESSNSFHELFKNTDPKKGCIPETKLHKLFKLYWYYLIKLPYQLISPHPEAYSFAPMWKDIPSKRDWKYITLSQTTALPLLPSLPLNIFKNDSIWRSELFKILFAATIFSLTKPILKAAKLPVDFVLNLSQLKAFSADGFEQDVYRWANFTCNPGKTGAPDPYSNDPHITTNKIDTANAKADADLIKTAGKAIAEFIDIRDTTENNTEYHYTVPSSVFLFRELQKAFSAPAFHHNFPTLFRRISTFDNVTTTKPIIEHEDDDPYVDDLPYFTKREIKNMCQCSNLPILLYVLDSNHPEHDYPEDLCLTITPILDAYSRDMRLTKKTNREELFDLYSGYLHYLSKYTDQEHKDIPHNKALKKAAKSLYTKKLKELGTDTKHASAKQQHVACILTALALLTQYIESISTDTPSAHTGHVFHIESRFKKLATAKTADKSTFATFLKELEEKNNSSIILKTDDDYLYLDYKKYWPAFETYCKKHDIKITESAAGFRRLTISKYLKEQCKPKAGTRKRFDCRRKINDTVTFVLIVSRRLINDYLPKSKPTPSQQIEDQTHGNGKNNSQ